ncbi:MAG TPA: Holliday junction resolvase RuvX [Fimbriimonadaceae bacterium]|nr:Holliday junction resolvase RuvX [Fimbriimonadaceae bacterium]
MRVIGVDLGKARIGVAVGVVEFGVATPRPNLIASGSLKDDAVALTEMARREEADGFVIGIPENDDPKMARACRLLAGHLLEAGYRVFEVDESFSTVEAENALRQTDLKASGRRKLRDGESARIILERFFDEYEAND